MRRLRIRHFGRLLHFLRHEGLGPTMRRLRLWWLAGRTAPSILPGVTQGPGAHPDDRESFWTELAERGGFHAAAPEPGLAGMAHPGLVSGRRKLALIGDLNLPQCRKYRVEQMAEICEMAGSDYDFAHYEDVPRAMDILQDATHVMLYRLRSHPFVSQYLYEARRLRLPVIYDIDDPLFSVPAYAGYGNMAALPPEARAHFIAEAPHFLAVMNAADAVCVSTPALRDHARAFTPRPVMLRRNFADRQTLAARPAARAHRNSLRICYASGAHGHEADLAQLLPELDRLLARRPEARLVILGHFDRNRLPLRLRRRTEMRAFTGYADYLARLAGCDLAIMPLGDDLFNRCKSGVRVIDAASVGVPSIVAALSDMSSLVEDGRSGLVVRSADAWTGALDRALHDPAALQNMGRAARRTLERTWTARLADPVTDPAFVRWLAA